MAKGGESYLQMRGLMLFVMKAAMRLISGPSHSHTGTSFSHSHPDLSHKKKRTQMMMRMKMTMVTISRENSGKVAAPWAVDSQSVPWAAGAHSQPSEDRSLFSFFL